MYNWSKTVDFYSAVENLSLKQDTTIKASNSTPILELEPVQPAEGNIQKDTSILKSIPRIDFSAIDSILLKNEKREKQILEQQTREAAIQRWYRRKVDTSEVLYKQFGVAGFPIKEKLDADPFQQNFLYNINIVKPEEKEVKQKVFIESQEESNDNLYRYSQTQNLGNEIKPKYTPGKIQFDWITIVLITSFLLLGWIRLFNKKYLGALIKSSLSYQESNTLYREKNSLMERASFMLNLLFLSNVSIFVIQLKHFFKIELNGIEDYMLYFLMVGSLIFLYIFRAISSTFTGFVFLKQKVFSEYFHNVNLFTKNTGLFLLPLVITLQFLSYEYLAIIVYTGIAISSILYLLQLVRSFQIINRKNVSIFYMILYLCAFEFAPFLIIYKVLVLLA